MDEGVRSRQQSEVDLRLADGDLGGGRMPTNCCLKGRPGTELL